MSKLIVIALALAACHGRDAEVKTTTKKSSATQLDLARELDEADRRGTQAAVRQHWLGLDLHWKVTRQRLLCQSADACHVAAFEIQRPAKHGWLPALTFAPGEFAKVVAGCGAKEQCELEIEGKLDELVASPEMPTSMKLSGVRVIRVI